MAAPALPTAGDSAFKAWYGARAKRLGLNADPDAPEHHYDYRAAHAAGAEPDAAGHWPSEFRRPGHPRLVLGGRNTATGQAATLWDIIPKDNRGRVWFKRPQDETGAAGAQRPPAEAVYLDRSSLTPALARWVDTPVPATLSPDGQARAGTIAANRIAQALERRSAKRWTEALGAAGTTARVAAERERAPSGVGWQVLGGATEGLPSFPGAPLRKERLAFLEALPPPRTRPERIARVVGSVGGFMATAFAAEVLTGGAATPMLGARLARLIGQFVAPGAAGALQEGTGRQRRIRGTTMAAAGGAAGIAGDVAAASVAYRAVRAAAKAQGLVDPAKQAAALEAAAVASGESPEVAAALARSVIRGTAGRVVTGAARTIGRTRALAATGAAGATFGAAQPWAENYWRRKTGEPDLPPITGEDMARGTLELTAFNLFLHGAGAAGAAARRGMARGTEGPERPPTAPPAQIAPPEGTPEAVPPTVPRETVPEAPGPGGLPQGSLPGRGMAIVARYERPMRGPANPLFGGGSQLELYRSKLHQGLAALPEGQPPSEGDVGRVAAAAARYAQKAEAIRAALIAPVPPGQAAEHAAATKRTDEMLVGQTVPITLPEFGLGEVQAKVIKTFWYPWDREGGFRVLVEDPASGDLVPLRYASPAAFGEAMPEPAAPLPERGPAGTLPGILEPTGRAVRQGEAQPEVRAGASPPGESAVREGKPGEVEPPAPAVIEQQAQGYAADHANLLARGDQRGADAFVKELVRGSIEFKGDDADAAKRALILISKAGGKAPPGAAPAGVSPAPQPTPPPAEPTDAEIEAALRHPEIANEWERMRREGATDEQIAALVLKGTAADEARAEAERLSGTSAPRGFDAEARAKAVAARAAEERGQGSLFGAPGPGPPKTEGAGPSAPVAPPGAPKKPTVAEGVSWAELRKKYGISREEPLALKEAKEDLAKAEAAAFGLSGAAVSQATKDRMVQMAKFLREYVEAVEAWPAPEGPGAARGAAAETTPSGRWTRGETDVLTLDFHAPFQNRDIAEMGGFTDPEYLQSLLRAEGGFKPELLEREPIMFWTDAKGEIGPAGKRYAISHHRTALAREDWQQEAGLFVSKGPMRRTVPTLEFKGTYAEALETSKDVNRQTRPNTYVEDVARATEIARGKDVSLQSVADRLKVTQGKAHKMLDFGHLAPDVQRSLSDEAVRDYGARLGASVARHPDYYVPDVQRNYAARIGQGIYSSASELGELLRFQDGIREAWPQNELFNMPSPEALERAWGRAAKKITNVAKILKSMARRYEKQLAEGGPGAAVLKELSRMRLSLIRPRAELVAKIQKDYAVDKVARRLTTAIGAGETMDAVVGRIEKEIKDRLGEPGPEGWSGQEGFIRWEALGLGLLHADLVKNTRAALANSLARLGKKANQLRLVRRGETVHSEPGALEEPDYWNEYATYRLMHWLPGVGAVLAPGGGQVIVPVKFTNSKGETVYLRHLWRNVDKSITHLTRQADEVLHLIVGDEGMKALEEFGRNDLLFGEALNGNARALARLPLELRRALPDVRALWHSHLDVAIEAAKKKNVKLPGRIEEYVPFLIDFLKPETLDADLKTIEGVAALRDSELKDRRNRFYLEREGYEPKFKSFVQAWRAWHSAWARKLALDPVIEATAEYLRTEGRHEDNALRAGQLRNWVQAFHMKRKTAIERHADASLRTMLFAQSAGAVQDLSEADAVAWVGEKPLLDAAAALGGKLVSFAAVVKGKNISFTSPKKWMKLGERAGMELYGGTGGWAYSEPRLKGPLQALHYALTENPAWVTNLRRRAGGAWFSRPGRVRRMLERRQSVLRWEHDPFNASMAWWNGGVTKAVMAWNVGATFVNALNPFATTLPEYGALTTGAALGKSITLTARRAYRASLKGAVSLLESRGFLTPEQAERYRMAVPLLAEELMLDALSLRQGESFYLRRIAEQLNKGRGPNTTSLIEAFRPLGGYALVEAMTRGLDMHAAWIDGLRKGYSAGRIAREYEDSSAGRMRANADAAAELKDPNSLASYVARRSQLTMFDYGPMGQGAYMADPVGKALGALTTWPSNMLMSYLLRPLEGGARAGAGFFGAPSTAEHRQAAKALFRMLAAAGIVLWLSDKLRTNLAVGGTSSAAIALLKASRFLFTDEETYKAWMSRALAGETTPLWSGRKYGRRSSLPWASPTGSLLYDWTQNGFMHAFLEAMRLRLPGKVEWARIVSENPDIFKDDQRWRWVADALGVRTFYRIERGKKIKHQLRLITPEELAADRETMPLRGAQKKTGRAAGAAAY